MGMTTSPPGTTLLQRAGILTLNPRYPGLRPLLIAVDQDDTQGQSARAGLRDAIDLIDNKRFNDADFLSRSFANPLATKIIDWLIVQDPDSGASFDRIEAFVRANSDWPSISIIRARAEMAMLKENIAPARVIGFFADRRPQSGEGRMALARAYLQQGDRERARATASAAWRGNTLSEEAEEIVLRDLGALLDEKDHRARLVRLIYKRKADAIKRLADRLDGGRRALALSAAAFLKRERNAAKLYRAVPAKLAQQTVLQYARIRYLRRRKNSDDARARKLLRRILQSNTSFSYPGAWWSEQRNLARNALAKGKAGEAYELVRHNRFKSGRNYVDVEYHAGWIALSWLKDTRAALTHFNRLYKAATRDSDRAMADFWLGQAELRLGNRTKAKQHFSKAATQTRTYYGQLAADILGRPASRIRFDGTPEPKKKLVKAFKNTELMRVARLLQNAGRPRVIKPFFTTLAYRQKTAREFASLAKVARSLGQPHLAVKAGKIGLRKGVDIKKHLYPIDVLPRFSPLTPAIEPALLLGLIRQESEFNPYALSVAGARGLMQLMPSTARWVANKFKLRYAARQLTDRPSYNLQLGSAYLHGLLTQFDGSYFLAAAAYNGGGGNVRKWIRQFGDPRTGRIDPVNWIESIPYGETRNYVKQVLKNVLIYRSIRGEKILRTLTQDLNRGVKK